MSFKQKFFSGRMIPPSKNPHHGAFVDVGGTGDCGFRAIAAGLLELYSTPTLIKGRDALLKPLLNRHDALFPKHANETQILTAIQRLQQLKKRVSYPQLVIEIAFTLRQIAVDELCANPERYPGAFVGEHEGTSPVLMRKMETWIDESSIAALSNALHLPITIQVVDGSKSLAQELQYNVDQSSHSIRIKLEKGHYVPYLRENALQKGPALPPAIISLKDEQAFDRSLPDILMMIKKDHLLIQEKFESIREALEAQLRLSSEQGGLNKNDLLNIYIEGMRTSDYLQGRVRYAGIESGNQHFFNAIKEHKNTTEYPKTTSQHDDYLVHELVHAISRALAIGHISPDAIYKDNRTQRVFQ